MNIGVSVYWIGQIVAVVAGLIGVTIVRGWIHSQWPRVDEQHLDLVLLALLVVGVAVSAISRKGELEEAENLQHTVDALRNYGSIARLDPRGLTGTAGTGLKETSTISQALEGAWIERDGKTFPVCNDPALEKFRQVANSSPQFPWSHYALAVCLRARKDGTWRHHAEEAVDIFESTTLLAGHHRSHDQGLQELRGYLGTP